MRSCVAAGLDEAHLAHCLRGAADMDGADAHGIGDEALGQRPAGGIAAGLPGLPAGVGQSRTSGAGSTHGQRAGQGRRPIRARSRATSASRHEASIGLRMRDEDRLEDLPSDVGAARRRHRADRVVHLSEDADGQVAQVAGKDQADDPPAVLEVLVAQARLSGTGLMKRGSSPSWTSASEKPRDVQQLDDGGVLQWASTSWRLRRSSTNARAHTTTHGAIHDSSRWR